MMMAAKGKSAKTTRIQKEDMMLCWLLNPGNISASGVLVPAQKKKPIAALLQQASGEQNVQTADKQEILPALLNKTK